MAFLRVVAPLSMTVFLFASIGNWIMLSCKIAREKIQKLRNTVGSAGNLVARKISRTTSKDEIQLQPMDRTHSTSDVLQTMHDNDDHDSDNKQHEDQDGRNAAAAVVDVAVDAISAESGARVAV